MFPNMNINPLFFLMLGISFRLLKKAALLLPMVQPFMT